MAKMEKRAESGHEILYLEQDMREFELYGTVRAVVSVCDCMNYITEEDDLLTVFKLVNNYLDPDGIFIFDMNTPYKYREMLGNTTIAENREEGSFIWENSYGKGKFVVDNFGLCEKATRGFFAASYSLLTDVMVYPVLNGSVFYLDDFPSPVPMETEHISNVIMVSASKSFIQISGGRICWIWQRNTA